MPFLTSPKWELPPSAVVNGQLHVGLLCAVDSDPDRRRLYGAEDGSRHATAWVNLKVCVDVRKPETRGDILDFLKIQSTKTDRTNLKNQQLRWWLLWGVRWEVSGTPGS